MHKTPEGVFPWEMEKGPETSRILVVDDEFVNRQLICGILRLNPGYEVSEAEEGPTALAFMAQTPPDLVLLDIMMPGMDGQEVCQRMQESAVLRDIPVIFVTALADQEKEAAAFARGAVDYITKPVNPATLKARVRAHLQLRRQRHLLRERNEQLARIAEELRQAKERLELRVIERTAELASKNMLLEREIEERRETQRALEKAREEAEKASQSKSEFLATISHEVRTPMTGAIGMLNLALETELTQRQREYLRLAKSSTVAMLHLLNNILDFSRAESGRLLMEAIAFEPAAVVRAVIDLEAVMAGEKGVSLEFEVDGEVPRTLCGDPLRLRQILLNLVRNAIKFTEQGSIRVSCRRSGAETASGATELHFAVRDTGIGISAEALEQIFAPFTQADASTTRRFGGAGLGLSICRKLVEMMGGRIWVESAAGAGATFHFTALFANAPGERRDAPGNGEQGDADNVPAGTKTASPPPARPAVTFDEERALARAGNRAVLAEHLADFLETAPQLLRATGAALAARNPQGLGEAVQKIRAAAARVEAVALGDEAFRLQLALRRDDWNKAQGAVERMSLLFDAFASAVREAGALEQPATANLEGKRSYADTDC